MHVSQIIDREVAADISPGAEWRIGQHRPPQPQVLVNIRRQTLDFRYAQIAAVAFCALRPAAVKKSAKFTFRTKPATCQAPARLS